MTEYVYYEYIVEFYNELSKEIETCRGVTYAASLSQATKKVEEYYRKECILNIEVTAGHRFS